jgi:hypothetical protein
MRDAIMATEKEKAWVVATGGLTNVAIMFKAFPEVAEWVAGVSIMGGAVGEKEYCAVGEVAVGKVAGEEEPRVGNWTRWAEFNICVSALILYPLLFPFSSHNPKPSTDPRPRSILNPLNPFSHIQLSHPKSHSSP